MSEDPASQGGWHLDRRIPVTLIVTVLLATIGPSASAIWWLSATNTRIDTLEQHMSEVLVSMRSMEDEIGRQGREDVSIAQQLKATAASLELLRIDMKETNALLRGLLTTRRPDQ